MLTFSMFPVYHHSLTPSPSPPPPFSLARHVDEWAIPVEGLPGALQDVKDMLAAGGWRAHYPIEIRFTAGDDIWLSPSYGRPTAWIGIIAYKPYGWDSPYKHFFRAFEEAMAERGGRPHWAKDFHWSGHNPSHFSAAYPKWREFRTLRAVVDPSGLFLNPWACRALGIDTSTPEGMACSRIKAMVTGPEEYAEVKAVEQGVDALRAAQAVVRLASLQSEEGTAGALTGSGPGAAGEGQGQGQVGSDLATAVGMVTCGVGYPAAGTPQVGA